MHMRLPDKLYQGSESMQVILGYSWLDIMQIIFFAICSTVQRMREEKPSNESSVSGYPSGYV
jgi:hypothetical protein